MLDRPRPDRQQGVFETLLIVDGRPIELDAHLARLAASIERLFGDRLPSDRGEEVRARTAEVALGSVRVTVAPSHGEDPRAELVVREVNRELVFLTAPVDAHSLVLAGGLGPHKWADRSLLDRAQSRLRADALPLLVDRDGTVLEASRANVFATWDGTLITPPADGRILPGITRARALEIATAAGLATREAELSRDDLLAAEEVFLTSSVRGVEPVRALDGIELAKGNEVGSLVAAELRRTWAGAQVG